MASDELGRSLVEGPGRFTVVGSLDPPIGRVRRVPRDARLLEGAGVDPRAVAVAVGEVHESVGHQRVEQLLGGRASREDVHRPPAAQDPLALRVLLGVRLDREQVLLLGREVVQVALEHVEAPAHRMDVRVLEAGHEHPAGEVDDLGRRADVCPDVIVGADADDAPAANRDRAGPRTGRIDRVDGPVHEG